ncbi:MAG TPA: hypothetical protein DHV85_20855 [Candidatus Accumulibacter sp.]|nr:hypothetical protein [Accumulibacter sp.]
MLSDIPVIPGKEDACRRIFRQASPWESPSIQACFIAFNRKGERLGTGRGFCERRQADYSIVLTASASSVSSLSVLLIFSRE